MHEGLPWPHSSVATGSDWPQSEVQLRLFHLDGHSFPITGGNQAWRCSPKVRPLNWRKTAIQAGSLLIGEADLSQPTLCTSWVRELFPSQGLKSPIVGISIGLRTVIDISKRGFATNVGINKDEALQMKDSLWN